MCKIDEVLASISSRGIEPELDCHELELDCHELELGQVKVVHGALFINIQG
jgi:hypothetical protein